MAAFRAVLVLLAALAAANLASGNLLTSEDRQELPAELLAELQQAPSAKLKMSAAAAAADDHNAPCKLSPWRPEAENGLCADDAGFCIKCKKPAWLLFPKQDPVSRDFWQQAVKKYWDYGFATGPNWETFMPPEIWSTKPYNRTACNQGQDPSVFVAPNDDTRSFFYEAGFTTGPAGCTLNRPYRYAYFSLWWAAALSDPNVPGSEKAALEQVSAQALRTRLQHPNNTITIEEVHSGKLLYKGPVTALVAHSGAANGPMQQLFNGTCGNSTFKSPGGVEIPYSQGTPDQGFAIKSLDNSKPLRYFPDSIWCGVKGRNPGYMATRVPSAYEVQPSGKVVSYTTLMPPVKPGTGSSALELVPFGSFFNVTWSISSLGMAIDLQALRASPDFKPKMLLRYTLSKQNGEPLTFVPKAPASLAAFCRIAPSWCKAFCPIDGATGAPYDPCTVKPGVTSSDTSLPVNVRSDTTFYYELDLSQL